MGFLVGDNQLQAIQNKPLAKWGVQISTRILNGITKRGIHSHGIKDLIQEVKMITSGVERYQARVGNNRDQVCTCRNQYSPIHEPKLSRYNGSIPWRVFEVKLLHLAQRYQWDNDTKLAKLVESLEGKALTFFSKLPHNVQCNFEVVRKKMNNRFIPHKPAITIRKNLQTIRQNSEEALEEWAEHCQQCAYDAWGEMSEDVAELAAVEAFLGGVLETEAAFSVMEKDPQTVDRALELI